MPVVLVNDLQDIEKILTSKVLTKKSYHYKFFEPWLGQGLFTASGSHWFTHRKLITPAFRFKILEKFIPIFNANIDIYLRKLDEKVGKGKFNIDNYITNLSLDIIAETAMDTKINAQKEESPYAEKVKDMTETIALRACRFLFYSDVIFSMSSLGRRQKRSKTFIENFINNLVKNKKEERNRIQLTKNNKNNSELEEKETVTLLDLLLETQSRCSEFTDKDILDEVNTFMFAKILTSKVLTKKSYHYKFFEPWLGQGLFTASGSHWFTHRKLITPAFRFKILEKFIPIFNANIDIYLRKLDEKVGKGKFNIDNYITNLSLDIIAETAMDTKINAQKEESPYAEKVKDMTETIALRACRFLFYSDVIFSMSSLGRRQKRSKTFIENFINNLVKNKKEERNRIQLTKNNKNNSELEEKETVTLLDLLLETQSRCSEFTDKDILDEVNTFMFAGHDTVTSSINFTLYLLSKHPTIQEEVLKEIESVIGEEEFTLSNLQKLKYLERVIKESLRILPVGPLIVRAAEKDIKLRSGYIIPAGCTMGMLIYTLHRNPEQFPNPEQFDPDRFLPENCVSRHPYAYLPFSAGPRNCIGQKFAFLEMKAIIAATVRRYKLFPSEDIKPVIHVILRSANGINLMLESRSSSAASNHPQLQRT